MKPRLALQAGGGSLSAHDNQRKNTSARNFDHRTGNGKRLRARNLETVATWNICGIRDKQPEIVEFMQKNKICVMGLSDVRKKRRI